MIEMQVNSSPSSPSNEIPKKMPILTKVDSHSMEQEEPDVLPIGDTNLQSNDTDELFETGPEIIMVTPGNTTQGNDDNIIKEGEAASVNTPVHIEGKSLQFQNYPTTKGEFNMGYNVMTPHTAGGL